jgi:hypothetical protein
MEYERVIIHFENNADSMTLEGLEQIMKDVKKILARPPKIDARDITRPWPSVDLSIHSDIYLSIDVRERIGSSEKFKYFVEVLEPMQGDHSDSHLASKWYSSEELDKKSCRSQGIQRD